MVDATSGVGTRIGPPPSVTPNARAPSGHAPEGGSATDSPAMPKVSVRQDISPREPLLASGETPLRGSLVDILI